MRRKQTSIRFSRFTLPHRYLRSISWISWEGGHRPPPAGFFHPVPQPAHASFSRRCLYPKAAIAALLPLLPPGGQSKHPSDLFPRKRKTSVFPFPRTALTRRSSCIALPAVPHAYYPRPIRGRSATCSCGPPINKKMRAHGIAPRTRKSVDFSLKKTHVGTPGLHALASAARTYSLTARIALFPFSFFTKEKKKENRSKFSRFEYIARTHFVRPHDVRDWPRASSAETKVAKSTDFCFIFESLPISL